MKKLLIATAAIAAMFAAAGSASAADQTVTVNGTVQSLCGVGNQSGGGAQPGTFSYNLGNLTGTDGFVASTPTTIEFGNIWCNGSSTVSIDVGSLALTDVHGAFDTSSFVDHLDMIVSNGPGNNFLAGGYLGAVSSVRTGDVVSNTGGAFETGTGQYSRATLNVALPTGTSGNDRPLAGAYQGAITVTATAN